MATSTVLQLANRVLRKHRLDAVADFSADHGLVVLDALNEANATIFQERRWSFQTRQDGFVKLEPRITSLAGTTVNGDKGYSLSSIANGLTLGGDYVRRVQFGGSTEFPNTGFQVTAQATSFATVSTGQLRDNYPGTSLSASTTTSTFVAEYILPSTVRDVLSVRHEETPLKLTFVDKQLEFDLLYPRPGEEFSDQPREVVVGGQAAKTQASGTFVAANETFGLVMRVHPIPDTVVGGLHYDYIAQVPTFTSTDTATIIRDVPEWAFALAVELAYAKTLQTAMGNEIQNGILLERKVMSDVLRKHAADKPAAFSRSELKSMDKVGVRRDNWPPRSVTSIDT